MTVAMPVKLLPGERLSGARCPRCDARLVYVQGSTTVVYCGGCGHEPAPTEALPLTESDADRLARTAARAERIRLLVAIIDLDRARLAAYEDELQTLLTQAMAVDPHMSDSGARYRARVLKAPRAHPRPCPDCDFLCATARGLAIHRSKMHGVPGITARRMARKAARKEAAR